MRAGATGIGLVRTELLFLGRRTPPSVAEQRNLYGRIRDAMAGRPVVFRTLDVGGDKPAAWQTDRPEANPALGVRGVRLGLARPSVLDDQLRALVESAAGDEVRIMLPMIASVEEVVAVRARLDAILAAVDRAAGDRPPRRDDRGPGGRASSPTDSPRSPTSSASGRTTSSSTRWPPIGSTRPWPSSRRRSSRPSSA